MPLLSCEKSVVHENGRNVDMVDEGPSDSAGRSASRPSGGEVALARTEVQDLERAEAAALKAAMAWSGVFAVALVSFLVYIVSSLGTGGLVFAAIFAVACGAPVCVPAWHRYTTTHARADEARKELAGLVGPAAPEELTGGEDTEG